MSPVAQVIEERLRQEDEQARQAAKLERRRPWHEPRSCTSKRRYETEHRAREHAKAATAKDGRRIVAYWCRYCFGFHIGHSPKKAKR